MTNLERIKNMTEEEFADYINSVYLAGIYVGRTILPEDIEKVDYRKWLNEEAK